MDNSTNSKMIKYQKRKDDTIVVVSGGKTWYTYLGELPVAEEGVPLKEIIDYFQKTDEENLKKIEKLEKQVSTLQSTLTKLIEKIKREKESDGL